MFDDANQDASDRLAIPGYDSTEAVLGMFGGGSAYILYAYLGMHYFQMTYQGMADTAAAKGLAGASLNLYQQKLQ